MICAVNVVLQRHPISSALSLIGVMASLAVLYLLLGAEFIAMAQIIVYAGAVMVLFVFVIMLLNAGAEVRRGRSWTAQLLGIPALLAFARPDLLTSSQRGFSECRLRQVRRLHRRLRAERRLRSVHRLPAAVRSHLRADSDRDSRRDRPRPKGTGLNARCPAGAEQRRPDFLVSRF